MGLASVRTKRVASFAVAMLHRWVGQCNVHGETKGNDLDRSEAADAKKLGKKSQRGRYQIAIFECELYLGGKQRMTCTHA